MRMLLNHVSNTCHLGFVVDNNAINPTESVLAHVPTLICLAATMCVL